MAKFTSITFFTALFSLVTPYLLAQRSHGGYYPAEKIQNLRQNTHTHPWVLERKDKAVEKASYWAEISDEDLWAMVPGQDLPRCIDVTFDRLTDGPKSLGCLKCGEEIKKHGNYPYNPDFINQPWKLTCPSCGEVFPKNDFGKFYLSALDEKGLFNPAKGDRTLLYNEEHPDPDDPLHLYGVDDGYGFKDQNGREHRFIGYYTWKYWMHINEGLEALADAFLFTGEKKYAHKAAILLDRIADVYPDMDWKPYADRGWYHSDGGTHLGKIEGSIWETTTVQKFAASYDKIISGTLDAPKLYNFLERQSQKYDLPTEKGSRALFLDNVDQRILKTAFEAVLSGQIRGNQGMHQLTVAKIALALNNDPQTGEWLDWIFDAKGGALPGLMITQLDRDGTSDEGAPSYSLMWGRLVTELASLLADYPRYTHHNIFEDYPQFKATFWAAYRMAALGKAIPNIGDSGATGLVSSSLVDPQFMALGYRHTRDPGIAIAAYRANGGSAEGLGRDLFSADPERIEKEIEEVASGAGPRPLKGYLMSGFGLALLETGNQVNGTALVSNYGRTIKHAHPDMLNFDLFAFGQWLTPDHGYPEFATRWPSNAEWTGTTLSHNTVLVNQQPQKEIWNGKSRIFKQLEGFGMFQLDGREAYPETEDYSRTMFLIAEDDSVLGGQHNAYVIDLFSVIGGHNHTYSFHGPPGNLTTTHLTLTSQGEGTYAGKDVPKGAWAKDFPIGYSHLYNVEVDQNPPANFTLDWHVDPEYRNNKYTDLHLRLHSLNQINELVLAEGDPPQNKPGNPENLTYALLHRKGQDLQSTFVTLVEPYLQTPFIKSVDRISMPGSEAMMLQINKENGATDYLLFHPEGEQMAWPNGIDLDGQVAFIRKKADQVTRAILINGTSLNYKQRTLASGKPIKGKVLEMNKELKGGGWIIVDRQLPLDGSLLGQQIFIENRTDRDASYAIEKIEQTANGSKLFFGPITFVNGFLGEEVVIRNARVPKDYTSGYRYDFEEGASFSIPNHAEWRTRAETAVINTSTFNH